MSDGILNGWAGVGETFCFEEDLGHLSVGYSAYLITDSLILSLGVNPLSKKVDIQISKRDKTLEVGFNVFKYRTDLSELIFPDKSFPYEGNILEYEKYIKDISEEFRKYLSVDGEIKISEFLKSQKKVW